MTTRRWLRGGVRATALGAAVAFALGGCAGDRPSAATPASSYRFQVREYAFPSGFRVVIEQDDTVPVAGAVLVVEAGALDDPPGKSGLAHMSEHLFVMAPTEAGTSMWKTMPRLGARWFNAGTGTAQTTYHAFAPRASLDELVGALTTRMADPTVGIDDALVAKELLIVTEEWRSQTHMSVRAQAFAAILPPAGPRSRIWAHHDHVGTLTLADVQAFADRCYRPERMTLVISGAIGADWDDRLQALLPQKLRGQAGERRPPVRRLAPVPTAVAPPDGRIATVKVNVAGPELWMAWPLPAVRAPEHARFLVMAEAAERLARDSLERSRSIALDVDVSVVGDSQASGLIVRARLRSAADAGRGRDEVAKMMEMLSRARVPLRPALGDAYRRAVHEAALQAAIAMEHPVTRAFARANIAHHASGAQISEIIATLQRVSADDIATFAAQYLKPTAARSALLLPNDTSAGDSATTNGGLRTASLPTEIGVGAESDLQHTADDDDDGAPLDDTSFAAVAWAPGAHRARVTTLRNGLTVIAMRRPGLPFVSMVLGFHGEPQLGEIAGVRAAVPRTWFWDLITRPSDRGILHKTQLSDNSYYETLNLFSADTTTALALIAELPARLRVHWPSATFTRWLDGEGQTTAAPEKRAYREFRAALFGEHAYRLAPALDAVRTVTGAEIQTWLQHTRRPNNGALVVVGDIDVDEVTRHAERLLSSWTGDKAAVPAPPAPPPVPRMGQRPSPQVLFTRDIRRRSTEVRFGCILPAIRTMAADVRSDVLARLFEHDLLRGLRFKLGASYGPDVGASTMRGGTALLEGSLDVADAALPEALDLLRGWLDPARPIPVTTAEFDRQRRNMARRSAFHGATNGNVSGYLFYVWNLGWPLAEIDGTPDALARMTVGDVTADLEACRANAVISILGKSPPPPGAGTTQ